MRALDAKLKRLDWILWPWGAIKDFKEETKIIKAIIKISQRRVCTVG